MCAPNTQATSDAGGRVRVRRSSSSKDRFERLVAHVDATDVGEQNEPIDVQMVAAVGDLCDGGVHVRQRKGGEQPESSAVIDHGATTLLVDLACEVNGGRSVAEVDPGRRDRQQRRGDAEIGPLPPRAGRPTTPESRASRPVCRGPPAAAQTGSYRGRSGHERRSSFVEGADPLEQGARHRALARSPCIE